MDRLTLRLTLLLVILYGPVNWFTALGAKAIACGMLAVRAWLSSTAGWVALLVLLLTGLVFRWFEYDNHQFLLVYWVFAINLSLYSVEGRASLAFMARTLLAVVFSLAVTWKFLGGEFLDGRFWQAALLTDPRLHIPARMLGGLSMDSVSHNSALLAEFTDDLATLRAVRLTSTDLIGRMAAWMGWYGVGIEILVAAAFLLPMRVARPWFRAAVVLAFLLTVYPWLPVLGFAWIVGTMAIASTDSRHVDLRRAILFAMLLLMLMPMAREFLLARL